MPLKKPTHVVGRKYFIKYHSKRFGDALVEPFKQVDCKRVFTNDYSGITINIEPDMRFSFYAGWDASNEAYFGVSHGGKNDEREFNIEYRLRNVDGNVKLTAIWLAG